MADDGMLLVNFGALGQGSADISKAISKMRGSLDECEQAAAPLVHTWVGSAQESYQVRQSQWRKAADDLTQILTNIKSALDQSLEDYTSTEKQAAQRFQ
jgi:early secretory antigenic target protein ESAT-6